MRPVSSLIFIAVLLSALCLIKLANGAGSKTYETSDGFPRDFLGDIVNSDVVQKRLNSRWKWEVWDVVPGTHAYQIYVFNITNPDEVEKGGKPSLQQLGPYYYHEYRYKFDVSMNLDLSVNFERNYTYTLDPSLSKGSEDDIVNTINIPLIVFSTLAAKNSKAEANNAVSALVAAGEGLVLRKVKVGDLLFRGVDVSKYKKFISLMGPQTLITDEFSSGKYADLKLKLGAHEGAFTVDSGLKKEKNIGQILTFKNRENLTNWNSNDCNKIRGSDGSVFPPHLQNTDKLYMLEVDLCRSISFSYAGDIQWKSIGGYLFILDKDTMEDSAKKTDNACYCQPDNGHCLKRGVLDVSSCNYGAPFVMSYAHFFEASPEYQQAVSGLHPDPKLHQTEVTIEPTTGSVISFHKRYQWNVWIKPIPGIDFFSKFTPSIVPILWNDDVFALDPDKEEILIEELARQAGGMGSGSKSNFNAVSYSKLATQLIVMIFAVLIQV